MLNTSRRLDWSTSVAPVLEECMRMMMVGGYSEKYYKDVLRNAVAVYDSKLKEHAEGTIPLNRPRGYKKAEKAMCTGRELWVPCSVYCDEKKEP